MSSASEHAEAPSVRLNKYLARSGVASRRKADALIEAGRVQVNGEVVTDFSRQVHEGDEVVVDGEVVQPPEKVYLLLNKPEDAVTTTRDRRGRRTVMDLVDLPQRVKASVFPVGRLDRDTLGVLLLTNDGNLAHRLMHPRYEIEKLYVARTREAVKPHLIDELRRGVELEDGPARADEVMYTNPPQKDELGIVLHEGRNRQIHRMMAAVGHDVVYLERIGYAGLTVQGVPRGSWRRLEPPEVEDLKKLVGLS